MFKSSKKRQNKGFSLAEMLIVMAIIGVLLAVAIPNVIGYYRSLKLTELDDSARSIFMAAQNRLTALKNEGRDLSALSDIKVKENPGPGVATGRFIAVTAAQADGLATLVPGGSIDSQIHDNHYVVEIDVKTGAVYAVWYWEKEDFTYKDDAYKTVLSDKTARLKAGKMVGYYGGSYIERPSLGQTPIPAVTVTNAEELVLEISVPGDGITGVKADVTITASTGGGSVQIITGASLYNDISGGSFTGRIALDTLKEISAYPGTGGDNFLENGMGKPFSEWAKKVGDVNPTITPGADFDIEVEITAYDGTRTQYLPQTVYCKGVNSLFASVDGNTAKIAYGRHLQNLDSATSGVNNTIGGTPTITAAEQIRPIDFADKDTVKGVYSWKETYSDPTTPDAIHLFKPIVNDELTSYDGKKNTISNLHVDTSGNAGLFGSTGSALKTITDTYLVDATVNTSSGNAGTLVGEVSGELNIIRSRVWLKKTKDSSDHIIDYVTGSNVGGLVGSVSTTDTVTIENSFASTTENGTSVGGLAGNVASGTLTIKNSYAAGYLKGTDVGGLVGGASGTGTVKVDDSYAAGIIASTTTAAGGISPQTGSSFTVNNSYAAVRYGKEITTPVAGSPPTVYGTFNGDTVNYYIRQNGVTYQPNSGIVNTSDELKTAFVTWSTSTTPGDTHAYGLTDETKDLEPPYPYPMLMSGTEVLPHYGDWLEEAAGYSFGYYDNGGGSSYGFWGYIFDPADGTLKLITNGLAAGTADNYATDDGYCIAVEQVGGTSTAPEAPTVDGVTGISIEKIVDATNTEIDGKTYDLYKVTGLEKVDPTKYYTKITMGSTEYWFNPFFACEVQPVDPAPTATAPTTPSEKPGAGGKDSTDPAGKYKGQVVIRTARQLANMAAQTGDSINSGSFAPTAEQQAAQKRDYVQLLNIDYDKYAGTSLKGKDSTAPQPPAALDDGGSYDGNHFIIRNLYIGQGDNQRGTGLFGNTKGELKNIRLVNVSVTSATENVGALAGRYQGSATVSDCGVYVDEVNKPSSVTSHAYDEFKVEQTADKNSTGGLIGSANSGTKLDKCFAAVKVEGHDEVGGLIGKLSVDAGNTTTLTDCYSGGHTTDGNYDSTNANVSGNKQVGGLIGYVTTTDTSGTAAATLSGVNYSTCSVSATDTSSNEIGLLIGGVKNDGLKAASVKLDTTTPASIAYATGKAFDGATEITPRDETTAADYKLITNLTDPTIQGSSATPHPYDSHWKTATEYPYLSNLGDHYGDWVEKKNSVEACFYWEKEGSEYKVYVLGFETGGATATPLNSGNAISTLCPDHHTVEEAMGANATSNDTDDWGYGTIGLTDGLGTLPSGVTKDPSARGDVITALKAALTGHSFEDADVTVYTGATADTSTTVTSEIGNPATSSKYTYHLNLGFGAAISLEDNLGKDKDHPYQIRNVRQLDNIPDGTNNYNPHEGHYKQTHDVYGKGYPIYTGASLFGGYYSSHIGTYDGQSYRILELNMTSGLFTSLSGYANLDNIILYSPSGTATVAGSGAPAGGLAGSVTNAGDTYIRNCVVAGYTMSNTSQVGGLVGEVARYNARDYVYITNSEAVNKLVCTAPTANNQAGGLVGQVKNGNAKITNSYAGGEITSNAYVGGIVGYMGTGSSEIEYNNVYSYTKIFSGSTKYCIGPCGQDSYTSYIPNYYKDCYYWDGCASTMNFRENTLYKESCPITSQTWDQLKTCISGTDIGTVENSYHTYWPANSTNTHTTDDSYPFPAVVKDNENNFVHYGDWPTP